jgi:hypothetical protein
MNGDELSGRALDAEIARRVFRVMVEERTNPRTGEKDLVYEVHPGQWVRIAFYSASTVASLNVELALRDHGWTRTEPRERVSGDVRVVLKHADGRVVEATGPMNTALCLAALKAVSS